MFVTQRFSKISQTLKELKILLNTDLNMSPFSTLRCLIEGGVGINGRVGKIQKNLIDGGGGVRK